MNTLNTILLPLGKEDKLIYFNDILFVEANNKFIKICVKNSKKKLLVKQSLRNVKNKLPAEFFFQTHRSYLVNLSSIKSICDSYQCVKLQNNKKIPLSKYRKKAFVEKIKAFCL